MGSKAKAKEACLFKGTGRVVILRKYDTRFLRNI